MTNKVTERKSTKNCVHHWIIDSPNGRESSGACKRCGLERNFANSTEQVMWEQTNTIRNPLRVSRPAEIRLSDEAADD